VRIKKILKFYPISKIFIYEGEFTPSQRKRIKSYSNIVLIDWKDKLNRKNGYKTIAKRIEKLNLTLKQRKRNYLFNQKPLCILDCAKRVKENLIYLDVRKIDLLHIDRKIDLLHIDTEGFDYEIIKSIDFTKIKPKIILYEHNHLSNEDKKECMEFLKSKKYSILIKIFDTLAYS